MRMLGELYMQKQEYKKAGDFLYDAYQMINDLLYSELKPSNNSILFSLADNLNMEEIYYIKALRILEDNAFGEGVRDYPPKLMNIEVLESRTDLNPNEKFYLMAFKSRQRAWRKIANIIKGNLALAAGSLGRLYVNIMDYVVAKRHFIQALRIQIRLYGEMNGFVAQTLYDLAGLYEILRIHKKAEKLALRSLSIRLRLFGKGNIETKQTEKLVELINEKKQNIMKNY